MIKRTWIGFLSVCALPLGLASAARAGDPPAVKPLDPAAVRAALEYSKSCEGLSLVIMQSGGIVFEDYHNGYAKDDSHLLASATKSFAGVALAALVEDKLLSSFDEKVSKTITEWAGDPQKSSITIRELLNLTSGLDPGPIGRIAAYAQAIRTTVLHPPGTTFQYGPIPYQIFGEVMKRILKGETPVEYLNRRIFKPIGLETAGWRFGQDNNPAMATGATLKAGEWLKFGELIRCRGLWQGRAVLRADLVEELLKPSEANPSFGIGFWLEATSDIDAEESGRAIARNAAAAPGRPASPFKIVMSAGAGKQRLYIIDPLELVVVRQGKASAFNDAEFLTRLLSPSK